MGKIRVYELATKLGLENKDMVDRLNQAGVDVKNHMSSVDEDVALKFDTTQSTDSVVEVEVQEERINVGLIRRRRAVTKEEPEPAPVVEEPPAAVPVVQKAEPVAPVQPEKPAVVDVEKTEAAEMPAPPVETAESAPVTPSVETKAPVVEPETEKKKEKREVVTRAKILGRVELPQPAVHQRRDSTPTERPRRDGAPVERPRRDNVPGGYSAAGRPAAPGHPAPGGRPATPAGRPATPGGRPATPGGRPTTPGGRPTTGRPPAGRPSAPGAPPAPTMTDVPSEKDGRAYNNKKKKKGRETVGQEADGPRRSARREVYEPDRNERFRKGKKSSRPTKKTEITQSKAIKRKIRISDVITIGELAKRMGVKANDLIKDLMRQGQMVTINHPLDFDSAAIIAVEFGYEVENVAFDEETVLSHASLSDKEEPETNLETRPPVVTIMGHVDHGKTSLLDAIRQANVTEGEAGGITQHIGAYDVDLDGRKITFLDTPGHEAFTSMRARGAQVTDLVVLVVAADDGVMPQTKEAVNHSKAAGVPIIVAVNKIDKPDANPDRVKQELSDMGLLPEDWGGETIYVSVSAKEKTNIDQLLEMILLQAEVLDLKANPNKRAQGSVIEARLDKGRGPVATVLVQQGTLKIGDPIVAGVHYGKVRSMTNDRGQAVKEAGPSFPVEVTGLTGVPEAGEPFNALEDEKTAKDVAQHRAHKARELELAKHSKISLEQLYARIQEGDVKELKVIVKADVQGSAEAVSETLSKLSTAACRLIVIHSGVGAVTETDISLASASDAIVLGFNVRPSPKAAALAETEGVDIRPYNVIYDAVNDVKSAMEGLLAPTLKEEDLGRAEVREAFNVTKVGTIAGCYVTSGKILRNAHARLLRDNVVVWTGKLSSLRRFKDDVREVGVNYECGIGLERYNDIKTGDIIEVYEIKESKTSL